MHLGLVNRVFDEESFDTAVLEYASTYTKVSRSAVEMTKKLLYSIDGSDFAAAIGEGVITNAKARITDDCKKGIARFLEK